MTQTSSEIVETATARLYGASELGVLSFTSPGDAHPRVEYVGGELFVGLVDANGVAITQGVVASWPEPFPTSWHPSSPPCRRCRRRTPA